MKKKILLLTFLIFNYFIIFSQGTNNNFDYDNVDIETITNKLGFCTFKFPVKQSSEQFIDIFIEEYVSLV